MRESPRLWCVVALTLATSTSLVGCGRGPAAIIGVDSSHDAFAASMIDYFPRTVVVHPGQTVRFRQRWSGEPHSVTFGASFNKELGIIRERLAAATPPDASEIPELERFETLPVMLGRDGDEFVVNQNGAQPCYLETGMPPTDPDEVCPQRAKPRFTGTQSYFSSGFIPYGGKSGNRFDVTMSSDIAPGTYNFYCNLHGVGQSGAIKVIPADEPLPPKSKVDRQTQKEMTERYSAPLASALAAARRDALEIDGVALRAPLAGAAASEVRPWGGAPHRRHFRHRHGSVDEFVPGVVQAKVAEPVTWTFVGRHTISFNVPAYLPVFAVEDDGTVRLDPRVHEPVGWSIPSDRQPGAPAKVDVGQWDGRGFHSTGLDWQTGDQLTITFTRRGSFLMACLIHPLMVGKVEVK